MKNAIKFDSSTGLITNRYFGHAPDSSWIEVDESDFPETNPTSDEIYHFYYDESTGDITVQYETVNEDTNG